MSSSVYHWCLVPECINTSIKTPQKLWIQVPSDLAMRNTWLKLARRDPKSLSTKTRLYLCEDHFDLENEMENYTQYKIMGSVKRIRMKPNCVPSRFDCQKLKATLSEPRHAFIKKQRTSTIKEREETIQNENYVISLPSCSQDFLTPEIKCYEKAVQIVQAQEHKAIQVSNNTEHDVKGHTHSSHHRQRKASKDEKPYKNDVCAKAYESKNSVIIHKFKHTNENPFKCVFCEYACKDNPNLKQHQNEVHLGIFKYPCSECTKSFANRGNLLRHLSCKHGKEENYICNMCGFETINKLVLVAHLRRIHTTSDTRLMKHYGYKHKITFKPNDDQPIVKQEPIDTPELVKDLLDIDKEEPFAESVADIGLLDFIDNEKHLDESEVDPGKEHDVLNSSDEVTGTSFEEPTDTPDLEIDLLDIVKEEPFAGLKKGALHYQNSPFKCDLCYKGFVDAKAVEKKHDEVLHVPKKRKSDNETEEETLKSSTLRNTDKDEENKAQNEDNRKISDLKIRSKKIKTSIKTIIRNNETTASNIKSDLSNPKIKANSNKQVTAPNHIFICDVCKKEYLCKSLLENHIKKWHIIEKPNSLTDSNTNNENCKYTNLLKGKDVLENNIVTENKLDRNKNKHKDSLCRNVKQYKCGYCMRCFSQSSHLTTHVRIHTGEQPYKCNYCVKCFSNSSTLAKHVRIHTGEKPYKCSYCTKCFTCSSALADHVRIHTGEKPYKCSYCMKCFSKNGNLANHVRIHTGEKPSKCSYCMKCFSDSRDLAKHVRIHTGEKPYKCSYCTKCFTCSSALADHVRIHTGEKPYKCSYCMKCFSRSTVLTTHVRIHTGEKPYKCRYCTKCFTHRGTLADHVRIHTGEKPYKCSYCMKCFSSSSELAKHVRIHTGKKPYKCSYCMKCFSSSCELATHVRIHTGEKPYKCSYCTKCFTQSSALADHVRIHTGEKPYKCSYCTKCFTQSSTLADHVRIHTGEKPYKCSNCMKCFTKSSALAKHVRIHTREKDKMT